VGNPSALKIIAHNIQALELQMQQQVDEWMKMQNETICISSYIPHRGCDITCMEVWLVSLECRHMDLKARYRSHLLFHG